MRGRGKTDYEPEADPKAKSDAESEAEKGRGERVRVEPGFKNFRSPSRNTYPFCKIRGPEMVTETRPEKGDKRMGIHCDVSFLFWGVLRRA